MDHAVNRAPLNHEMSTESRGSILPAERGSMIGKHDAEGVPGQPTGTAARNAFELPSDIYETEGCEPTEHLATYLEGHQAAGDVPFKSEAQRRFMFSQHPDIAHAWAHGRSSVTGKRESASQQGKRKSRSKRSHRKTRRGGR